MIKEDTIYLVKNRSAGQVVYTIPEWGVRRTFAPGETQKVAYKELEKLTYQPGGKELLISFLQIQSEEALQSFNMNVQPEYHMSEAQVVELLREGSLDAFLDCLDYAPTGVIDLVKKYAVELPLSDFNKRKALKEKIGFDVDAAIAHDLADKDPEPEGDAEPAKKTDAGTGKRRTKVVYKNPQPTAQ